MTGLAIAGASRRLLASGLVLLLVAGCGSDKSETSIAKYMYQSAKGKLKKTKGAPAPTPDSVTAEQLAQYKTPMIMAEIPTRSYFTFVVPYGVNGDVETWASVDKKTIAFRDGLVIGTRGFGPDIMQSQGPTLSQVASGSGTHPRIYFYLDGADQEVRREFTCTLANLGADTVTVVQRQHTVRHVTETCTGKSGDFTNEYWFENGDFLRKSKQLLISEWGYLTLSRVVDKG